MHLGFEQCSNFSGRSLDLGFDILSKRHYTSNNMGNLDWIKLIMINKYIKEVNMLGGLQGLEKLLLTFSDYREIVAVLICTLQYEEDLHKQNRSLIDQEPEQLRQGCQTSVFWLSCGRYCCCVSWNNGKSNLQKRNHFYDKNGHHIWIPVKMRTFVIDMKIQWGTKKNQCNTGIAGYMASQGNWICQIHHPQSIIMYWVLLQS